MLIATLAACGGGGTKSKAPTPSTSSSDGPLTEDNATTIVSRAVLGNHDLGPGWSGKLLDGGDTLDDPTLDVCHQTFASDDSRLARNQTVLFSETAALSNEVVGYKPGGAKAALEELSAVVKTCKDKTVVDGTDTYRVTAEVLPPHSSWGTGAIAIRETGVDLTDATGSFSTLAVYQAQGDILTAVYEFKGNVPQDLLFQVADLAATRLAQALTNTPRATASIPVPTGTPIAPEADPTDPGRAA